MSFLEKIKQLFSSTYNDPSLEEYSELTVSEPPPLVTQPQLTTAPIGEKPVKFFQKSDWPLWLEDEEQLRDEGVLFGLTDSKPDEKIAIIKNYFAHQTATLEQEVEQYGEKIQEINLFIEQREGRIGELKAKLKQFEQNSPFTEHQLLRTSIGLTFSVLMCVGNYFLIESTLKPLYGQSRWIALGVFLAGMFNLFGKVSIFHENSTPLSWRRLLEEVGMPLAASTFVFVQALQQQPYLRAISLFCFVFFLFLFTGKLLLSNLTLLHNDLRIWSKSRAFMAEANRKTETFEEEITKLEKEIDSFRIEKWQLLPDLNRTEAERTRLNTRRDVLIKLFESEFLLARQMKNSFSSDQLREIMRE